MKKVFRFFAKFLMANAAVVLTILLLPVFLISSDVGFFDSIMDYLFNNNPH